MAGSVIVTVIVGVPRRVVAATLTELLGPDEYISITLDGLVADGFSVHLADTPAGVRVSCPDPVVAERIRARAMVLATAPVIVGTAIVRGRALLAQQRAYPASAAGMWELPGGRVEPGESDVAAVRRECLEELGVEVVVGAPVGPDVALPGDLLLRIYRATLADPAAVPRANDHAAVRWLTAASLDTVPWLPADRVLLPAMRELLEPAGSVGGLP